MVSKTPKVYGKYALEPEGRDVHGRFTSAYNESSKGKAQLLGQCVAGGFLLRECGLLTLTTEICESEEYMAATSAIQRRAILVSELSKLAGISLAAPVMPQAAAGEAPAPSPVQEQQSEPETPHSNNGEDEQPEPEVPAPIVRKGPQMRTSAVLPDLGASTSPAAAKK